MRGFFRFIKDAHLEMFHGDMMGKAILSLLVIVEFLLGWMVGWGLLIAVDSWYLPTQKSTSEVVAKSFAPAHTTMVLINNFPHYIPHPDTWTVCVRIEEEQGCATVTQGFYNTVDRGQLLDTEFVQGRLTGDLYPSAYSHR